MQKRIFVALVSICLILSIVAYIKVENSTIEQAPLEVKEEEFIAKSGFWSYEGENGPKDWMHVDSSYEPCGRGQLQSPINIKVSLSEKQSSTEMSLDYTMATFILENNGHTIQAYATSENNTLIIEGKEYDFVEMHFHTPSEHQINGQSYDMETHLIHESDDGDLAVIGLFAKNGEKNDTLAEMWSVLPTNPEDIIEIKKPIDLVQLLPREKSVYHYVGSLTTPPCTEGVQWFVLEQPIEMSKQQIESFSSIFAGNNRPVQKVNNREIKYLVPKQ